MDYKNVVKNKNFSESINSKKTNIDINQPGWIYMKYDKNNGNKITYSNGKTLKEEKEKYENSQEYLNWQMEQISYKISENLNKYIKQYYSIHGEGAYDIAYKLEPIYPDLDLETELEFETDIDLDTDTEQIEIEDNL